MVDKNNLSSYVEKLKEYVSYSDEPQDIKFSYVESKELQKLKEDYKLNEVQGNGINKIINLMVWVHSKIKYDGQTSPLKHINSHYILNYCKNSKQGINCWMAAVLLTEVYLALGYKARYVRCYPYNYKDADCHVVTTVFFEPLNKWIMLDPSFQAYFTDENNNILSIEGIRNRLANNKKLKINDEININGTPFDKEEYLAYMSKNLFRFESLKVNCFGADDIKDDNLFISLSPLGYDSKQAALNNIKWLIENYGDEIQKNPDCSYYFERISDKILNKTIYTHNSDLFWNVP